MTLRQQLVGRLVTAAVSLAVAFALIEIGLRLTGYPMEITTDVRRFVQFDAYRGWRNVPHADGYFTRSEYRVHLQYNTSGIRGPERPYIKPPGTYRIVVLGDSFVDGYSVAQGDRVTEQLERSLNAVPLSRQVEVIALGAPGYSTDQELLWLQSEGLQYQPDLVVLMFYFNDIIDNAKPNYWRGAKPMFTLNGESLRVTNVPLPDPAGVPSSGFALVRQWGRDSKLYALGAMAVRGVPWLRALASRAGWAAPLPQELTVYRKAPTPEVTYAWHLTDALLRKMKTVVEQTGASFLAFHIPFRACIYPADWESLKSGDWLEDADWDLQQVRRRFLVSCGGAPGCIEPTARFLLAAETLARTGDRLYYQYDNHWNAHGHALAAQVLHEHLLSHGLVKAR